MLISPCEHAGGDPDVNDLLEEVALSPAGAPIVRPASAHMGAAMLSSMPSLRPAVAQGLTVMA